MIYCILIYFIITSALLSILLNNKIEESVPIIMLLCGIIISFFTYIQNVFLGILFSVFGMPLILLLNVIIKTIKKGGIPPVHTNKLFTVGLFAFILLCLYGYLLGRNRYLSVFDEYTFWAIRPFDMLKYNRLYTTYKDGLLSAYTRYPLFFSSIQCLFCFFGKSFQEPYLYIANNICCFSFTLPLFALFDIKKPRDIIKSISIIICISLLGICISRYEAVSLYECIYVDYPMIYIVGYSFYLSCITSKNNKKDLLVFIISIIGVLMSKQICLFFSCLIIINFIINNYDFNKNSILYFVCIILLLGTISLYFFNKVINISVFNNIFRIISDKNIWEHNVFLLFISEMFFEPSSAGIINLPYIWYLLLITITFILISKILFNKETFNKNRIISSLLFAGGILWSIAQFSFTVSRINHEIFENHLWLPSYGRYMGSYLYMVLLCLFFIFIYELNTHNTNRIEFFSYILPILIFLCTNPSFLSYLLPSNTPSGIITDPKTLSIINVIDTVPDNNNILIVEQYEEGYTYSDYINLYYYEYGINKKCDTAAFGRNQYATQHRLNISSKEYLNYISKYNYLYVLYADTDYITRYWEPTSDVELLVKGLYKININNKTITLDLIGLY